MVKIGDEFRFRPAAWLESPERLFSDPGGRDVTGIVIQVNEERHWFRVQYDRGGVPGFECFKF